MNPEAVKVGTTVVRDPQSTLPESRSWYKIVSQDGEFYVAQNITSRTSKRFAKVDFKRLIAAGVLPHSELDLSALLGRRVKVELAYGVNVGTVTEVSTRSTIILGAPVSVPVGISLDGELLRWPEIMSITEAP